jgi:hypothetical protein
MRWSADGAAGAQRIGAVTVAAFIVAGRAGDVGVGAPERRSEISLRAIVS